MKKLIYSLSAVLFVAPAMANTQGAFREVMTVERTTVVRQQPQAARPAPQPQPAVRTTAQPARVATQPQQPAPRVATQPQPARTAAQPQASEQKYILANPFFQPRAMSFSSVTDLSYRMNSFDFKTSELTGSVTKPPHTGKYTANMFALTQNLSFGITDEIAILGMARFSITDLNIDWKSPALPGDDQSINKLDLWGIGVQWKFLDNRDWIATTLASYQSLVDAADMFIAEARLGFKNDDTIIYGFARGYYINWDGHGYGLSLKSQHGDVTQFTLNSGDKRVFYYDLGVGIFAALNEDWSVDANLTYTDADWHSQVALGASVAYQPWRNAALKLYGRIALWDSADGFESRVDNWVPGGAHVSGTARLDNYSDMSVGLQLIMSF